jgi:TolB protein
VFASTRDDNWELYIAQPDGSNARRVTNDTGPNAPVDVDPVWSPNGQYIAYESLRGTSWDIYLFDVTNGVETRLTRSPGHDVNPYWAADSKSLLFQSFRDGFWQIYSINIETLEEIRISDGIGDDHDPQYSDDGAFIIFRSYRDGFTSVLYVVDADGQNLQRISDPAGNAENAVWSDDGALIAYQSDLDGDLDIYIYEVATGLTRKLTDNDIRDYAPTWYCESHTVIFTSEIRGPNDPNIFAAQADPVTDPPIKVEEQATQLTDSPALDQYPQNTPAEENASRQSIFPAPLKNK